MEHRRRPKNGYILLDITIGLFIFGLCFSAILGVNHTAALGKEQNANYLEAVNIASSTMEEILNNLEHGSSPDIYLGMNADRTGNYDRQVTVGWESLDILLISVQIKWLDRGNNQDFILESLFYVEEH